MIEDSLSVQPLENLHQRLGALEPIQIQIWRQMSPARRIELACQAYHFALEAIRVRERQNHPELAPHELAWRVTRRLHGNPKLGR